MLAPAYTLTQDEADGYVQVSGTIDAAYLPTDADIYLLVAEKTQTAVYPAFPVGDTGYSLRLPPEALPADATQTPVVKCGDSLTLLKTSQTKE